MAECEFKTLSSFAGVDFRCHKIKAFRAARDNSGLDAEEFKVLGPQMCTSSITDEQRVDDCPAFKDMREFGPSSEYAVRQK